MFTGLVGDLGSVAEVLRSEGGTSVRIATALASELKPGDSVAVNGVCLTATELDGHHFAADVVGETLLRSTLGSLETGAAVNIELPLRAADRLGGHVMLGHIDGVGEVREHGAGGELVVAVDPSLLRYIVEKGSVALDGVSLTVAGVDATTLTVALIPETSARTTLGEARAGVAVNVEVDILAKHVEKLLGR